MSNLVSRVNEKVDLTLKSFIVLVQESVKIIRPNAIESPDEVNEGPRGRIAGPLQPTISERC